MKKHFIAVLMTLSFLMVLSPISISAQSNFSLTIEVPFSFVVDGVTVKPGQYTIERLSASVPNALVLKGADGRTVKAFLTSRIEVSEPEKESKLVFARYGEKYFLSEIWTLGQHGRKLPSSSTENELRDHGKMAETRIITLKTKAQNGKADL